MSFIPMVRGRGPGVPPVAKLLEGRRAGPAGDRKAWAGPGRPRPEPRAELSVEDGGEQALARHRRRAQGTETKRVAAEGGYLRHHVTTHQLQGLPGAAS